jgi:protein tyrosine/serine phosphatase
VAAALTAVGEPAAANRPAAWAQPVALAGAPNLHRVTVGLYRSAQPDADGMRNLKQLGIKTVINLRAFHSDRDELGSTGLRSERLYLKTWHPEEEDAVRFLKIATDTNRQPVLVHCQHGADRTGTLCAVYRIAVQGWSREEAIREMRQGGYGFHPIWKGLPEWILKLDIDRLRQQAGITPPAKAQAP